MNLKMMMLLHLEDDDARVKALLTAHDDDEVATGQRRDLPDVAGRPAAQGHGRPRRDGREDLETAEAAL